MHILQTDRITNSIRKTRLLTQRHIAFVASDTYLSLQSLFNEQCS